MRSVVAALLLVFLVALPGPADAQTHPSHKTESAAPAVLPHDVAMVGGAVLGLVMASGIVGMVNAGSMIYGGAAFADALEGGANLAVPMALLGVVVGAVLGADTVQRNAAWLMGHEAAKGAH